MKKYLVLLIVLVVALSVQAQEKEDLKFNLLLDVTQFYLDGEYIIGTGSFAVGVAYSGEGYKAEPGLYISPVIQATNKETFASVSLLLHIGIFKKFGIGFGYDFWKTNIGLTSPKQETLYFTLNYTLTEL
ncbi:MAG: hypothetical protein GY804_01155 [Alphaproteobacteria bacterium]|nr:hypothetical protein [Alphaproteobacteria bacterium]